MSTISISPSRLADEVPVTGPDSARNARDRDNHAIASLDCVVVQVDGELDITGLETFRRALDFAISGTVSAVVVDLRRTRFLSLRNAAELAAAIDRAALARIETHLLTRDRQVDRALEVTGARDRARRTMAAHRS